MLPSPWNWSVPDFVVLAIWIELPPPYSEEKVLTWTLVSWMVSGFGVRFRTPCRIALVTLRPSMMNLFATVPCPFALASTAVSVE